jgi:hypothetical protein
VQRRAVKTAASIMSSPRLGIVETSRGLRRSPFRRSVCSCTPTPLGTVARQTRTRSSSATVSSNQRVEQATDKMPYHNSTSSDNYVDLFRLMLHSSVFYKPRLKTIRLASMSQHRSQNKCIGLREHHAIICPIRTCGRHIVRVDRLMV